MGVLSLDAKATYSRGVAEHIDVDFGIDDLKALVAPAT
jgi:hypothetical protein